MRPTTSLCCLALVAPFVAALPQRSNRRSPSLLSLPPAVSQPATPSTRRRDNTLSEQASALAGQIATLKATHATQQQQVVALRQQLAATSDRVELIPIRRQYFAVFALYKATNVALNAAQAELVTINGQISNLLGGIVPVLPSSLSFSIGLPLPTSATSSPISSKSTSTSVAPTSTLPTSSSSSATPSQTGAILTKSYEGATFFDDWYWADYADPTHGAVDFVNASYAETHKMGYVNSDGVAVMSMDHGTSFQPATSQNRKSVRISSNDAYNVGTLAIIDLSHIPYGPGVWPAFWMVGPNWPYNGEIDIVEQVNSVNYNQAALHSAPGCTRDTTASQTGTGSDHPNCDSSASGSGLGCSVSDTSDVSFGPGFAAAGGGVWAMQWTSAGIFIWRFTRSAIPSDISSGTPDSSKWGTPFAAWPASTCSPTKYFADMNLVFDITLCGDWAGDQYVWNGSGAPSKYKTCQDVVGTASLFNEAYFEVNYVKMYSVPV